jgi:Putative zinc-finger
MMQTMDCNEARMSLGVYVLGAIDPAERALVDAHLATCQECRDELVDLAGLPALLSRVSKEDALQMVGDAAPPPAAEPPSPPELLGTVLDLTAARRRRRVWRNALTAAAAAVIIAAGSFTGAHYLASSKSGPPPGALPSSNSHNLGPSTGPWDTVDGTNASGQATTISYEPMGWGTQVATKVVGIPVGTTCQLYIITKDGKQHLVSSWITDTGENNVWYTGGTSIAENDIEKFELTTGTTPPIYVFPH